MAAVFVWLSWPTTNRPGPSEEGTDEMYAVDALAKVILVVLARLAVLILAIADHLLDRRRRRARSERG
jgi:hypothetical protein